MSVEARKVEEVRDSEETAPPEPGSLLTTPPPTASGHSKPALAAGRYAAGNLVAGKYQLCEVLGEGGMGSVWLAKNRTLDVDIALKLMRAELAEDVDGVAERMLQEARAAARIGHPAIIQVFDFGFTEHGDPFIVMELLQGESLGSAIRRRGRLSPTRAVQTLLPIVDALAAAHESGIVHRDLKPENIFLSRPAGQRLQPKVLDFGIAKLEQKAHERLTRDGAVIGSPAYMAPEQVRGESNVDARADIWALSVVLYQMITGRRPFEGENYHASMWNVVHAAPHPLEEQQLDEPELARILYRGLAKDPAARFQNMRSFGRELAVWLFSKGVQEDIGDASIKAWLVDNDGLGSPLNSFFPSSIPGERKTLAEALGRPELVLEEAAGGSSGTRRIVLTRLELATGVLRNAVRVTAPRRRAALVTLGCAALAFAAAVLLAAWLSPDAMSPEPEPQIVTRPKSASAVVVYDRAPRQKPVRAPRAPLFETEAPEAAEPADPDPKPATRRPARAPAGRAQLKSELKDPFR